MVNSLKVHPPPLPQHLEWKGQSQKMTVRMMSSPEEIGNINRGGNRASRLIGIQRGRNARRHRTTAAISTGNALENSDFKKKKSKGSIPRIPECQTLNQKKNTLY